MDSDKINLEGGDCTDDAMSIDLVTGSKLFSPLSVCSVNMGSPKKTPGPGGLSHGQPKYAYLSGTQLWKNSEFMAALQACVIPKLIRNFDIFTIILS